MCGLRAGREGRMPDSAVEEVILKDLRHISGHHITYV